MQLRLQLLTHLQNVLQDSFPELSAADDFMRELEDQEQYCLSGILNRLIAEILSDKGPAKLSAGYIIAAFDAFKAAEAYGVCHYLHRQYPHLCDAGPYGTRLLGEEVTAMLDSLPTPSNSPTHPVAKRTESGIEVSSINSKREERTESGTDESLDTLT